jgi:hypothetical protein
VSNPNEIINVVGARPNFVKIAPLLQGMRRQERIGPLLRFAIHLITAINQAIGNSVSLQRDRRLAIAYFFYLRLSQHREERLWREAVSNETFAFS